MRLLLDTHVLLWWLDDPALISAPARSAIRDPESQVFVSAATVWEIVVKKALGKLEAPDDLAGALSDCGFTTLSISLQHALALRDLPAIHCDPFDRMLIAQASLEGLHLVTRDPTILTYPVAHIAA